MVSYLYVSLSEPLQFGVWDELDIKKPMGWFRADYVINKNYVYNKLKVLTIKEVKEIRERLLKFRGVYKECLFDCIGLL